MQATPDIVRTAIRTGQDCVEHVPFSGSGIVVCVHVAVVVYVAGITNFETGAHAPVSFCALLLLAFLSPNLALTGLARLTWLPGLVGLTTRLATSTA
jgi:hypothetical protein